MIQKSYPPPRVQELLFSSEAFSALDCQFGLFLGREAEKYHCTAALSAALVSRAISEGNICLDLDEFAGKPLPGNIQPSVQIPFVFPARRNWAAQLLQTGIAGGDEDDTTPLVLVGGRRLYLRRYREYENCISRFIRARAVARYDDLDLTQLGADLKNLFKPLSGQDTDWQQIGALAAVSRSFCVISGGPGTGKTFIVARILSLLKGQFENTKPLRFLLAAPTGKAAARLQQAIAETGLVRQGVEPVQAYTLHRMLGNTPGTPYFRHDAKNPLKTDIVIVDEASMVDLPLMAKLMQAIPASARLVLLGDRFQLASVQPGSVLGDICRPEMMNGFSSGFKNFISKLADGPATIFSASEENEAPSSLSDSFIELAHSFRFARQSSIARLSRAVKKGDGIQALKLLQTATDGTISWSDTPDPAGLGSALGSSSMMARLWELQQAEKPGAVFDILDNLRLLCGLRRGPFGVENVNRLLEQHFARRLLSEPARPNDFTGVPSGPQPPVRPIMISKNDYNLRLFNGDVGIIMPDPENSGALRAFFRDETAIMRNIAPALLPEHESVFAMTVHKSQGSEFGRVLLVLPDSDSPLLTRELVYTAITRAREHVEIWGRKEIFMAAVERQITRTSGLAEELQPSV